MSENVQTDKFMGLENEKSSLALCKFAVVPVPFEKTVCYGQGTAKGPAAVIEASTQIELWDEETKTETWEEGIATLPAVNCAGSTNKVFKEMDKTVRNLMKHKNSQKKMLTQSVKFMLTGLQKEKERIQQP